MWRANACRRTTLPVPVFLNRLDAPLWVFNFGIEDSWIQPERPKKYSTAAETLAAGAGGRILVQAAHCIGDPSRGEIDFFFRVEPADSNPDRAAGRFRAHSQGAQHMAGLRRGRTACRAR